jgi:murein DD-endopeptidase MepM/ murein hydrolase activator NlpD
MKIIILTNPYKPYKEIDVNAALIFKLSVIPLLFWGIAVFLDLDLSFSGRDSDKLYAEQASYQLEKKIAELQKRIDASSMRMEYLAQRQDDSNKGLSQTPQLAMLAAQQYIENRKGGPLTLSNKIINSQNTQIQLDSLLRQTHEFEYHLGEIEKLANQPKLANQSVPTGSPIQDAYEVSSPYGYRTDPFTQAISLHEGIDLSTAANTKIYATADGVVTQSGEVGDYGLLIEIQHETGLMTRYGHVNKLFVQVGDSIKKGQLIGLVGSTGRSTGNHLHYEVLFGGQAIDPQKLIKNN